MTRIDCALGDDPVYLDDWTVETDGELHAGVALMIDADEELIVDFSPDQARSFARELVAAADRAAKAAQR